MHAQSLYNHVIITHMSPSEVSAGVRYDFIAYDCVCFYRYAKLHQQPGVDARRMTSDERTELRKYA